MIAKQANFPDAAASGKIGVSGNAARLAELIALMDEFPRMFEIVEPKRTAVSRPSLRVPSAGRAKALA